jgi:hypothetical protein
MESLLVTIFVGLGLVVFGAMALVPLVAGMQAEPSTPAAPADDQVISIRPVAIGRPLEPRDVPSERPTVDAPAMYPHRHAA